MLAGWVRFPFGSYRRLAKRFLLLSSLVLGAHGWVHGNASRAVLPFTRHQCSIHCESSRMDCSASKWRGEPLTSRDTPQGAQNEYNETFWLKSSCIFLKCAANILPVLCCLTICATQGTCSYYYLRPVWTSEQLWFFVALNSRTKAAAFFPRSMTRSKVCSTARKSWRTSRRHLATFRAPVVQGGRMPPAPPTWQN